MFTEERQSAIEKCLRENGKVKVKELSEMFQVTEDCIRKDLKTLENAGKLKRTYGGAILSQDYPLKRDVVDRRQFNLDKKRTIAAKAFKLIKNNETIFLDISTTNIELAKLLATSNMRVVVVSNMIDILQILATNPSITAIGTGGTMYQTVNGFMGAATIEVIKQYSFDRAFIGSCGVDMTDCAITTLGVEDGLTKKAAVHSSRHKYVVMERDKFYFNDSYKYAYFDDISGIVTDEFPEFVKKFIKRKTAVISLAFIVFIILMAIIGPYVVPYDPQAPDYTAMMQGPSAAHIWGTNEYGQDVFSRLMVGTRLSLTCALTATIIGTAIGVVLGLIAGFYGGIIDSLIMRCCDVLFAFPDILLAIAVVAIIGQGMVNVMIAVAVFTVPSFARIIRSATISVKQAPYVEVARSLGCSNTRILFVHIFPGTIQSMIVNFTMRVGTAILAASSLSFLGFGANVTEPDWGSMLSTGRNYLNTAPHMVLFPGILIFLTVLAFNLLGDGLRDTLDPKMN